MTDLATSIPGIDEAMSFAEVMRQVQTMDYEAIVFDTAPTGHTLRLLQFPTTLQKGLEKLMSLKGTIGSTLGPIAAMLGINMDDAQSQLLGRMEGLKVSWTQLSKCLFAELTLQAVSVVTAAD